MFTSANWVNLLTWVGRSFTFWQTQEVRDQRHNTTCRKVGQEDKFAFWQQCVQCCTKFLLDSTNLLFSCQKCNNYVLNRHNVSCPEQLIKWPCHAVSHSGYFYFGHTKSDPRDSWPLRHLIRVMRKHDLKKMLTMLDFYNFDIFDNVLHFCTNWTIWKFRTIEIRREVIWIFLWQTRTEEERRNCAIMCILVYRWMFLQIRLTNTKEIWKHVTKRNPFFHLLRSVASGPLDS